MIDRFMINDSYIYVQLVVSGQTTFSGTYLTLYCNHIAHSNQPTLTLYYIQLTLILTRTQGTLIKVIELHDDTIHRKTTTRHHEHTTEYNESKEVLHCGC